MAHAYMPGLKVSGFTEFERERRLPLKGQVLVEVGQRVDAGTVVARTELPGNVVPINLANQLSVPPADVEGALLKPLGSAVEKGEVIAKVKALFGLTTQSAKAPARGTLESVSRATGQLILREPPLPVEVDAYVGGVVSRVLPDEGVVIASRGAFVQGIFGIGGETRGALRMLVKEPAEVAGPERLGDAERGCVVVCGAHASHAFLAQAVQLGVAGVVAGGLDDRDLRDFLGYDLGVAITGTEDQGLTVLVTEGFGQLAIAGRTFRLLAALAGRDVSLSGATQIRAGVMRPEILCPLDAPLPETASSSAGAGGLQLGAAVRAIRQPYFGQLGTVVGLPPELHKLETEALVRVVEVDFGAAGRRLLPRANVELLEA